MHKQFQEDHYLYWSVMSAFLQVCGKVEAVHDTRPTACTQANDPTTPENLRPVVLKLAHRLLTQSPTPSCYHPDRFHLHLTVLKELGLYDEAYEMLEQDTGKLLCGLSLVCEELRREIWKLKGLTKEEGERAEKRILEAK